MQRGLLARLNVHCKNYAMVQNKLANTIKQYIMTITGSIELSRDVLHKNINFMSPDIDSRNFQSPTTVYQGKNYGISFIRQMSKRGIQIINGIRTTEERFLG
jgi:hypothetical protein